MFGDKAYRYKITQKPWKEKKLDVYSLKLDIEIAELNAIDAAGRVEKGGE